MTKLLAHSVLVFCFAAGSASTCYSALVFLKGSDDPLHVRTISENDATIIVGVPRGDGSFEQRVIERRNIDQFIPTVSKDRLAELDPSQPARYRDYAEELAEKRIDPDARDAAIRLYLIAAHLDSAGLGRSALLGMVSLARSPAEERKFRAMAYLLDPKHDRSVLKESTTSGGVSAGGAEGRDELLTALRTLRQGNRRVAERLADRPSVKGAFAHYRGSFSLDDFLAACDVSRELDDVTLARIIRYELEITGAAALADDAGEEAGGVDWSATLAAGNTSPAPTLTLVSLTEFDPELCVFREGKWVRPE